ncbi:dienelactone hydrolase family protein [Cesiribacter andamanensis]|uniref:Putative dienelactone hydrolase n=1 Tax=Cesiribacter andamanensis AMV16 TaxID=1279009 RepID=M7N981_9BACT|nr:dienelactone hydrolase family protein [Cesiribacter andamanensis]EMR03802.1 putative dienelactone hydrolase [Cesiribacter andamanensis AMV16]
MQIIREALTIPVGRHIHLEGELILPDEATGLVLFSHGSGSSRLSPRNQKVARLLQRAGLATLLFDLLTEEEDQRYENRFDIALLAGRLVSVTRWAGNLNELQALPIGYFGASTGAASALMAAARLGEYVQAVVCRGGRPDLALPDLPAVTAPSLLIVGALDHEVVQLNETALARLSSPSRLEVVPGAGHLFEEPGKLEQVAQLAADWYRRYLQA